MSYARLLRQLVVVLVASLAGLALVATPSSAQEKGPRAEFSGPAVGPRPIVVNSPGAPVRCEVSFGNDVTVSGGTLNVTWAVACRWTDDGQLSTEVDAIYMQIGIRKNGRFVPPTKTCLPILGPAGTCNHSVPFDGTAGRYDSVMAATVTWNDGYPPIRGQFFSPGFILT
jgi:hypothetical protein